MQINVRFFILDYELEEPDYIECSELEFIEYQGLIEYKRNSIRENGVNQICLLKSKY